MLFNIINDFKKDINQIIKSKIQNYLEELDLVSREEFNVLKERLDKIERDKV